MSYILDALRKSENERRQGDTPGITAARYRVDNQKRSIWLPVVGAILIINAALLVFLLLRPSGDDSAPLAVGLPPEPVNPPPMASAARPAPKVRPLSREVAEAAANTSTPVAEAPQVSTPAASAAPTLPSVPSAAKADLPAAGEPARAASFALPSMQQLVLDGKLEMLPLRMDMHVYSEEPSQRFVFINMAKYREGERLKEGPQIESIDSAGVILFHQGQRFTLARE